MTWPQKSNTKIPYANSYQLPLRYLSIAKLNPLEKQCNNFMEQVKGLSINMPFVEAIAKMLEY